MIKFYIHQSVFDIYLIGNLIQLEWNNAEMLVSTFINACVLPCNKAIPFISAVLHLCSTWNLSKFFLKLILYRTLLCARVCKRRCTYSNSDKCLIYNIAFSNDGTIRSSPIKMHSFLSISLTCFALIFPFFINSFCIKELYLSNKIENNEISLLLSDWHCFCCIKFY